MAASLLGRVLRLPTAGGASDFLRADQPCSAGTMHFAVNNVQHLAAENSLRHLYTFPGWQQVCTDMPYTSVEQFDWNGYLVGSDDKPRELGGGNDEGTLIFDTGPVRIKRHTDAGWWPRVEWRFRWLAPNGFEIGAFAVALREGEAPSASAPYASATYAGIVYESKSLTIDTSAWGELQAREIVPQSTDEDEGGSSYMVRLMLGVWCTSDTKATPGIIAGVTCFLREPA